MDGQISAIIRGEFLYRDILLVDCGGDLKRHARASESDIRRLLNGKEVKDQVGHWYEAQLIHYGLQRSKDKNAAKVRLQQALNQGKLKSQPPHLADMEGQMKKEYAAAVRKAKKGESGKGTKRGRDEDESVASSKKTKVSVTVDGVSINVDRSESSKAKSTKATTPKATVPKAARSTPKTSNTHQPKSTPKTSKAQQAQSAPQNAKATGSVRAKKAAAELLDDPRDHPDNVFQRSNSFGTPHSSDKAPKVRSKQTARKSAPMYGTKVKGELEDQYDEEDDSMDIRPDISQGQLNITGVYNIDCPLLADQSPEDADNFRLFLCVDNENGLIWGGFELAWKSGIIKIDDIAFNKNLSFGWRAKDYQANGSLRFGKGCFGEIEFYGHEQVSGAFHNLFPETVIFRGTRRAGPLWCGRSSYKFKQEWDDYPREAYGR